MAKQKHAFGLLPDPPDEQDYKFKVIRPKLKRAVPTLPKSVDLGNLMSPIRDQGQLGACHDVETEVLTDSGWKLFSELDSSERLATVNPETSDLTYEHPTRLVRYHYHGEMVCGRSGTVDFKVTPDHNMLVRKWDESARTLSSTYTLTPASDVGWYFGLLNRVNWHGESPSSTYTIPGVVNPTRSEARSPKDVPMSTWLKFLGLYLAEGTMLKRSQRQGMVSYKIQIAAVKDREKTFAREVLQQLGVHALELKDRFTFSNKQVYKALASLGLEGVKAGSKFVPKFVFRQSADMISTFLLGHFMGDGTEQHGVRAHYTGSHRLADDLQTLVFLSGQESHVSVRAARVSMLADGRSIVGTLPEHRISVCERKNLSVERKESITREQYDGEVFCAEVPTHHTLVTRRNGCILVSGNCTAFAVGVGLGESIGIEHLRDPFIGLSPLFLYYVTRARARNTREDTGATLRGTMKSMAKVGTCPEELWPYDIEKFAKRPAIKAYKDTTRFQFKNYYRVTDFEDIKIAVAAKNPVALGIMIYSSFETAKVAKDGLVPMPNRRREELLGGHAVLIMGYDDDKKLVKVRNSWGTSWGDKGYFYLPYDWFDPDQDLASDMWTAQL